MNQQQFIPKNAVTYCNKCALRKPYTATCKKYPKVIPFEVLVQKDPCKEFVPIKK